MPEMLKAFIANKGLLVRSDGKCLFVLDSGKMPGHKGTRGLWDMPGGRMDLGEMDMVQSLRRELKEEVGYNLPMDVEPEVFSIMTWKNMSGLYICGHFYRIVVADEFEPVLSEEHNEFIWEFPHNLIDSSGATDSFSKVWKDYTARYLPDIWQQMNSESSKNILTDNQVLG